MDKSNIYFSNGKKIAGKRSLNLFKVVKRKSCFILLRGILVMSYGSQINAPNYTKIKQTLKRMRQDSKI
jgi:hypothetical protein